MVKEDGSNHWEFDLTSLPSFQGLTTLSTFLTDRAINQFNSGCIDINVEYSFHPNRHSNIGYRLGIDLIKVVSERDTFELFVNSSEEFQSNLRILFGTLEAESYRKLLLPEGLPGTPLVFHFGCPSSKKVVYAIFVLESFLFSSGKKRNRALRITVDIPFPSRLNLANIPHVKVNNFNKRTQIKGSTHIIQTWIEILRRETEGNRRTSIELKKPYSHLFQQLSKAKLDDIEQVTITWDEHFISYIFKNDLAELHQILKRVLLSLEDHTVRKLLSKGEEICIRSRSAHVYLDQSNLGRVC